jgi:hypothetical protein
MRVPGGGASPEWVKFMAPTLSWGLVRFDEAVDPVSTGEPLGWAFGRRLFGWAPTSSAEQFYGLACGLIRTAGRRCRRPTGEEVECMLVKGFPAPSANPRGGIQQLMYNNAYTSQLIHHSAVQMAHRDRVHAQLIVGRRHQVDAPFDKAGEKGLPEFQWPASRLRLAR